MILIFDLGATNTRFAMVENGRRGPVTRIKTDGARTGFEQWVRVMREARGGRKLEAVVGGMAGQLVGDDGRLTEAPNLPNWLDLPVRKRMQELFDCPIFIENDVVMGGLGEAYDGGGTIKGVMVYFTVSTGVNAVRLVDGRVDDSISRFELGRQLVEEVGSGTVMLESVLGGSATQKRFGKAPAALHDPQLWELDEQTLARVVYNTDLYWTPDLIVFGGSMMRDIQVDAVRRAFWDLPETIGDRPKLVPAKLGDLAGLHGAWRWWEQQKSV